MSFLNSVTSVSSVSNSVSLKNVKDFRIYIISDISIHEIDLNDTIVEVKRYKESLLSGMGVNLLDWLTLGIPKLIIGSSVCHEFIHLKSRKYEITVDFVYTSSVVIKIAKAPTFLFQGRKQCVHEPSDKTTKKVELTITQFKDLCRAWLGKEYHLIKNNCQHFCDYLMKVL